MLNGADFPPITVLPVLLSAALGSLEASEHQLASFRRVKNRPYSLDNQTIHDVIRSCTKQNYTIAHEKAICAHWRSQGGLSVLQKKMLKELEEKLLHMEEVNLHMITLANQCKLQTIEKLIKQDDTSLAIDRLQEWFSSSEDLLDDDEVQCLDCGETVAVLIYADDVNSGFVD